MKDIKEILLSRGCPATQVDTVANKIENVAPQLKPAISAWLDNGAMPLAEAEGFSTQSLMERFKGMQYPAAILLIDWLIKDPATAKKAIAHGIK